MPRLIRIDDPADPRIEPYRALRERDLVGREGLFVAEGETVVRLLLAGSRHRPVSLLLADKRIAKLSDAIADLPDDVPVHHAAQPVLDAIAGYHLHRGVLALGRRAPEPSAEALLVALAARALVVGLIGLSNHDNVGGVFRNAAAFGADAVLLDPTCCDPLYRKAVRVSAGGALRVPFARLAADESGTAVLRRHGFEVLALSPAGGTPLHRLRRSERTAVLFGAEGPGLPPGVLADARTVRIDMAQGFDSLNVATTSGIVLHALTAGQAA